MGSRLAALLLIVLAAAGLASPVLEAYTGLRAPVHRYIIVVDGAVAQGAGQEGLESRLEELGASGTIRLSVLPGYIALLPDDAARLLDSMPGVRVYRDRVIGMVEPVDADRLAMILSGSPVPPRLEPAASNPSIGADILHERGITGRGVKIAVLDTGIEDGHPYLQRNGSSVVVAEYDATGMGVVDYCGRGDVYYVLFGGGFHGTHVAGIIAGQSIVEGVAPGADLYDVIVAYEGPGYNCVITASAIIAGLDYAVKGPDGIEDTGDEADIINLSIGASVPPWVYASLQEDPSQDPLIQALANAAKKTLVVVAAGNEGPGPYTLNAFCSAPGVICVGAADDKGTPWNSDDTLADFSSRGPEPWARIEPAVAAPGVNVNSTLPTITGVYSYPASGTSMAAPHVAGALALLIEGLPLVEDPSLLPSLLVETGYTGLGSTVPGRPSTVFDEGGGLIRVDNATRARLVVPEARVYIYTGNEAIVRHNVTIQPLYPVNATLNLTLAGLTEYNTLTTPPPGAIKLEQDTVTIAGGRPVNATITVNASMLDPGVYTGYLVVDDGFQPLTVPLAITVPARPTVSNTTITIEGSLAIGMSTGLEWNALPVETGAYSTVFDLTVKAKTTPATVLVLGPDGSLTYPAQRLRLEQPGTYIVILQPQQPLGTPETVTLKAVAPRGNLTLDQLAGYLDSIDKRLTSLENTVAGLNQTLTLLNQTLDETLRALALVNQTLTAEVIPRLDRAEANITALAERLTSLEQAVQDLANTTLNTVNRVNRLQQDIDNLKQQAQALAGELAAVNETLARHEAQLGNTTATLATLKSEVAAIAQQLAAVNATLAAAQASIQALNQTLQQLTQSTTTAIQALAQRLEQATQDIASLQAMQEALAANLTETRQQLDNALDTITAINETVTLLQARIQETTQAITQVSTALDTLEQLYQDTSMRLNTLEERLDQVKTSLATLQEDTTLLEARIQKLEEANKENSQETAKLKEQIEKLQEELDMVTRRFYTITILMAAIVIALGAVAYKMKARA